MEQNKMKQEKMEQEIREKLGQRTIQPSEAAWDRLDAMLTVAEGKKTKRRYGWLYVASSVLGFLFIAVSFFGKTDEVNDPGRSNEVVVEDAMPAMESQPETTLLPADTKVEMTRPPSFPQKTAVADYKPAPKTGKTVRTAEAPSSKFTAPIAPSPEKAVAQQQVPKPAGSVRVSAVELLASVDTQTNETKANTSVALQSREKVKVDANSLLSQVDGELETTFRERALRTVSRNYQNVKVALSNRNKE